jgi:CheY-like chemotaxis protein
MLAERLPRVLIAEDDASICTLLVAVLKREGFTCEVARNGLEAIRLLTPGKYAAVLLDLMMPVVSGFEVIEHLERTAPEELHACVIVLTAVAEKDLKRLHGKPVFRVLRKPFDMVELLVAIRECVARSAAIRDATTT